MLILTPKSDSALISQELIEILNLRWESARDALRKWYKDLVKYGYIITSLYLDQDIPNIYVDYSIFLIINKIKIQKKATFYNVMIK
jgi:hypothetical protein